MITIEAVVALLGAIAGAIGIVRWSAFVSSRYGAPRWIRWVGPSGVFGGLGMSLIGTTVGLVRSFRAVDGVSVDPADKARLLAEGISEAMHCTLIGLLFSVASIILLFVLTCRYHWFAKLPKPKGSPPYR